MATSQPTTRHGFYFYPDFEHYFDAELHAWIPELIALGASWLTILAPSDRAIPEIFIRRLIDNGIQPILHMPISTAQSSNSNDLSLLFNSYSQWGVKYITLFDRPNLRKNWSPHDWAKDNLVERFLDIFIPIAEDVRRIGLTPVFPPLEPGGDYWDTAFLFGALQGIQRRGNAELLNQLILSAYAWSGNRSPNWGAGGPERWPRTRPYLTPQDSEDHRGFRIFDWYLAINQAATGISRPIILLAAGSLIGNQIDSKSPAVDIHAHTWQNMNLVQLMAGQSKEYDPVPSEVLTCNFWLLSASEGSQELPNAWYKPGKDQLPIVSQLKDWVASGGTLNTSSLTNKSAAKFLITNLHPISHYLLLPSREWGSKDVNLDTIRPFINKFRPTIGFSPVEASHAKKVTIVGTPSSAVETIIDGLLAAGCVVESIGGDGMNIAS